MSQPVEISSGRLVWSGEHWINGIRTEGSDSPSAWISLFHTRYSEAGEGNTAQVFIPGEGVRLICTDNSEVCAWISERFFSKSSVQEPDAKIVEASFSREGATHRNPAWVIQTPDHRIVARWQVIDPPVIAYGSFRKGTEHFSLLFFTEQSSVELDGREVPGQTYLRDIWKPTIGGQRSSSVFALAETLIEMPQ